MKKILSVKIPALILAGVAALTLAQPVVTQAAPISQQKTQAPGYYRMMLGELEITALYDGATHLPTSLLKGINEQDAQKLLARMFIENNTSGVQTAVNGYLINTGKKLILVDAGTAQCFGPTLGNMLNNLQAAGYQPAQIDTVLGMIGE